MISPTEKAEVYRGIRAVLAQHYIDLGRLAIVLTPGGVRLGGELMRLPGMTTPLTADLVEAMIGRIKRIPRIPRLRTEFTNWQAGPDGRWSAVGGAVASSSPSGRTSAPLKTLRIDLKDASATREEEHAGERPDRRDSRGAEAT